MTETTSQTILHMALRVGPPMLGWFATSIGLNFYNKFFLHTWGFAFPLTYTGCHMVLNFLAAGCVRAVMRINALESSKAAPPELTVRQVFRNVAPAAVAAALDIGLTNASLLYFSVGLVTMCKSATIVWLLMFAICFGLERPRPLLFLIVTLVSAGVMMFSFRNVEVTFWGLVVALGASIFSGLRWVLAQILMDKGALGLTNPVNVLFYITPIMGVTLMPLALATEGPHYDDEGSKFLGDGTTVLLQSLGFILLGAVLAFCMNLSEYRLLGVTSSISLSIMGVVKEITTVLLSLYAENQEVTALKISGLFVGASGIAVYNYMKITDSRHGRDKDEHERRKAGHEYSMLPESLGDLTAIAVSDEGMEMDALPAVDDDDALETVRSGEGKKSNGRNGYQKLNDEDVDVGIDSEEAKGEGNNADKNGDLI
eukprot:Clim_evm43s195 gene=Clim_evmTU43s195